MAFSFSVRSLRALAGVDEELKRVTYRALQLTAVDFIIVEGLRSIETQRQYVAEGKSKTLKSNHLTGKAIDFVAYVGGKATYNVAAMTAVANAFKAAAQELEIPINWGGDWKTFKDTPHIELKAK